MNPWQTKNILHDFVLPTLSPSEQLCLIYLIRHQLSLTANQDKTISHDLLVDQFADGTHAGQYVFDLGTGLKKDAIKDALKKLLSKKIINESYYCKQCAIYQNQEGKCLRCDKKTFSAFNVHNLSLNNIRDYLNEFHEAEVTWNYDEATHCFYSDPPLKETKTQLSTPQDYTTLKSQLREKLWFPLIVDKAVEQATKNLKTKKVSDTRIINGFYKPVLVLQEEFPQDVVRHALEETVKKGIAGQKRSANWTRYARAVAVNSTGQKEVKEGNKISQAKVKEILDKCQEFNAANDSKNALEGIKFLLRKSDEIREHFSPVATIETTHNHLLEAFKKGIDDYMAPQKYSSPHNYLPNWSWGDEISESWYNKKNGGKK